MPRDARVYEVFIASPGDVMDQRAAIDDEIQRWNRRFSKTFDVYFEPIRWETDAVPAQGIRGQAVINEQLLDRSDFLIGVFWTRLGSSSGKYVSGTLEELTRFRAAGKPHMLLFKTSNIPLDHDVDKLSELRAFKKKLRDEPDGEHSGLTGDFDADSELREYIERFLTYHAQLASAEAERPENSRSITAAELPVSEVPRRSYFDTVPNFAEIGEHIRSRKACISFVGLAGVRYGGTNVIVGVRFRNEGRYPAYDVRFSALDEAGNQIGAYTANELVPATTLPQTGRIRVRDYQPRERQMEFALPYPPDQGAGEANLTIQLRIVFRDGLETEDEARFVLTARAQGREWRIEEDRSRAVLSSFCRHVRPQRADI